MTQKEAGRLGWLASRKWAEEQEVLKRKTYDENPNKCQQCSNRLGWKKRRNKFCNQSCAATYNNTHKEKKKRPNCLGCGDIIEGRTARKYCSNKCQGESNYQKVKAIITKEGVFPKVCSSTSYCRRYLIELQGEKCKICNIRKWTGVKAPLLLDHIDGNSSNDAVPNIRLICHNCDALLPTYKNRNKGNGRAYRRQRYALGLSY